jgi:glycosyltransferase involved in cell wall biosynthesis
VKRIAILFEYPSVNGGENSMLAALQYLTSRAAAKFSFVAIAPESGPLAGRLDELGIERHSLSMFADDNQRRPRDAVEVDIRAAVNELRPDLLHGNSLSMGRWLGRMADSLDVQLTTHLRDIMGLSKAAVRDLNRNARLMAVSNATRDFHVRQGIDPERIRVVRNGINADEFARCETARQTIRVELGIPENAVAVLTAGQIGLRKGLDTLAEAAVALSGTHVGIHWLLAGERFSTKDESIEFERSVDRQFRLAGARLTYHRLGWRSDMARVMSAADILVHAARQEPLGRVLLEAAAAGLAIVATDVGGTSEILHHEESALLVAADQPQPMTAAIKRLVENQDARLRFGQAARRRIQSSFRLEDSADRLAAEWRL